MATDTRTGGRRDDREDVPVRVERVMDRPATAVCDIRGSPNHVVQAGLGRPDGLPDKRERGTDCKKNQEASQSVLQNAHLSSVAARAARALLLTTAPRASGNTICRQDDQTQCRTHPGEERPFPEQKNFLI